MGSHVAVPESPFDDGFRKAQTISTGGEFLNFLAAFTLFYDLVTASSIKLAPVLVHKETLDTLFYACANHGYHILSLWNEKTEANFMP